MLQAAGPAQNAVKTLKSLALPGKAADQVAALSDLVTQIELAAPDLSLTVDPGEFRGFEYQTGLSFTLFARNVRGELGRGGRYHLINGEPATGFTLFLDSIMRAVPTIASTDKLYVPFASGHKQAAQCRKDGWSTIKGLNSEGDSVIEAKRLGCTHILKPDGPEKIA